MKPVDAVVAVTYRCNARCAMCGIWKSPPTGELPPEYYRRLPSSLRSVNLTGGEPFLREDLPEIHAAVRAACPRANTMTSTNGLLTTRILAAAREMKRIEPHLGIAISIDGPKPVHDRVRGVPGAYERAMATVEALRSEGIRNLRLAFTITEGNAAHFLETYELACRLGVEFTCAIEHNSAHYFQNESRPSALATDALREQLAVVIRRELATRSPRRWARAYFMEGMWRFATGQGRLLPCRAGGDFFFLDPVGDLYACNAMPFRMGNLREQRFEVVARSPEAIEARKKVARCRNGCWMVCTARPSIRRAWPKVLAWALWRRMAGGGQMRSEN